MLIIGTKVGQTQKFLEDGTRIPVTIVSTPGNTVLMHKTQEKDGYFAVQLGLGNKKNANKPQLGHAKKAQLEKAPLFVKEARLTDKEAGNLPEVGSTVAVATVLEPGAMIDVVGVSKGKGFAGGVKRYHFRGGPKTHGQSDRHRAPGSIGSTTTPGRVYKGKRMAGKMGNDTVTVKNLEVVEVGVDFVWVKGVVPGINGALVVLEPTGKKSKKFVAVLKEKAEEAAQEALPVEETQAVKSEEAKENPAVVEEVPAPEAKLETQPEQKEEVKAETSIEESQDKKEEAK